jgi:cell division protein FtsQ
MRRVAGLWPAARRVRAPRRAGARRSWPRRFVLRFSGPIVEWRIPRGAGVAATALFLCLATGFGVVRGDRVAETTAGLVDLRDAIANTVGFRITSIQLAGGKQITREELLTTAGVTGRTSLLFLDATAARARLKTNPWIAEATVLKLYPGRLRVAVTEREAFALWQKDGKVSVISSDGTVLEPYVARRFADLPLVVGAGAETGAKDFLAVVDKFPTIRGQVGAAVLVAERRWNLKLKNGMNVQLPEADAEDALRMLVQLDRDKKLLTRDIAAIDLRLPDRVSVRLSDEAYEARESVVKALRAPIKKGGHA